MIAARRDPRLAAALLCLVTITACSRDDAPAPITSPGPGPTTDVIGIEERFLTPTFWTDRVTDGDEPLMSPAAIADFNRESFAVTDNMVGLADFPAQLTAEELLAKIRSISRIPSSDRYYPDGPRLGPAEYERYEAALDLGAIEHLNPVGFGMAVRRANMRTYPTHDVVLSAPDDIYLDRFQENALFPADAVAILHASADGRWLLVQSYNYLAWVEAEAIATGEREAVLDYHRRDDFVVVTGSKVFTNFNPHVPAISELQLDMGVRLPLLAPEDVGNNVYGQNPYASYAVELPVRDDGGHLGFAPALIARSADVTRGFLPYTRDNIIRQSFKFLGERYGWGHSYNARDCSGFVSEIYKTFGIYLPRNSSAQRDSVIGLNTRFAAGQLPSSKTAALDTLDVGNLIFIPGHVMLYLGSVDGHPYVIHDVAGLNYKLPDGNDYSGTLSGVSVTPLLPLRLGEERSYLDSMLSIKKIR